MPRKHKSLKCIYIWHARNSPTGNTNSTLELVYNSIDEEQDS